MCLCTCSLTELQKLHQFSLLHCSDPNSCFCSLPPQKPLHIPYTSMSVIISSWSIFRGLKEEKSTALHDMCLAGVSLRPPARFTEVIKWFSKLWAAFEPLTWSGNISYPLVIPWACWPPTPVAIIFKENQLSAEIGFCVLSLRSPTFCATSGNFYEVWGRKSVKSGVCKEVKFAFLSKW